MIGVIKTQLALRAPSDPARRCHDGQFDDEPRGARAPRGARHFGQRLFAATPAARDDYLGGANSETPEVPERDRISFAHGAKL